MRGNRQKYPTSEHYREETCGCVWMTHAATGADVTKIKACFDHRSLLSMSGKIRRELSR